MIKKHSDDPDVGHAAQTALGVINDILNNLPVATEFDYGGHELKLGDYGVCERCTKPIAEAQAAHKALLDAAGKSDDETVKEHITLAATFFDKEAQAATIRAEFHNGIGTENILDRLLGFQYDREIHDDYQHSHHQGTDNGQR